MKKIVGVFVCILFLVISVIPGFNGANITGANFLNNPPDQLDQYQTLWNDNLGCDFGLFMAQSFKPAYPTLTRVELLLGRHGELYTKLKISIRSSLDDDDLTLVSILPNTVPKYEPPGWIEFDFNDIQVNPGQKYYIIYQPGSDFDNNSNLVWYRSTDNPYKNGEAWHYNINRGWIVEDNKDCCFKTYGYGQGGNNPPNKPSATYKRDTDELVISATDPDNDQIRYGVSWDNDYTVDQWTNFVGSGTEQRIDCNDRKGTIGVISEDEFGAQSDWFSVTSKSRTYYFSFFERLFQRFPFLNKILNRIPI